MRVVCVGGGARPHLGGLSPKAFHCPSLIQLDQQAWGGLAWIQERPLVD